MVRTARAGHALDAPVFHARRQRRVRAYFRKFGSKVVFLGRFTPGLRFRSLLAGTCTSPSVFFIYDTLAAAISVPVLVYLAWFFGGQIDRVVSFARHTEHGILVAVVVVGVVFAVRAYRRRRRRRLAISDDDSDAGNSIVQ